MSESNVRIIKCLGYSLVEETSKKLVRNGSYCALYVTTERMIVAPWKRPFLAWFIPLLVPISVRSTFKKAEENLGQPLDGILDQDKDNYQIPNNSVIKMEMKKGNKMMGGPRITIQTSEGKHAFMITTWEVDKQTAIVEDFQKIFGERFVLVG